jgi:hypothetical protein
MVAGSPDRDWAASLDASRVIGENRKSRELIVTTGARRRLRSTRCARRASLGSEAMTGWLIRHPRMVSVLAIALVAAAVATEVVDLIHLSGAMRIGAALLFAVTTTASFVGFRAAWRKKAREGTLVVDPEENPPRPGAFAAHDTLRPPASRGSR